MKKLLLFAVISLMAFSFSFAQSIVRGKVTDENGESVIGATIRLKSNLSVGTTADVDGNYSLKIASTDPQVLVVSYLSYKTVEEQVHPVNGQVIIRNFVLTPEDRKI